jgi:drug/metabolite transporter (DMT)-like permease
MKNLLLVVFAILFNVTGQLLLKTGMNQVGQIALSGAGLLQGFLRVAGTPLVLCGLAMYVASAAVWIVLLSRVNLSWAYPLVSVSPAITALFASLFLGEKFSVTRMIGTLIICAGVAVVARTPSTNAGQ